MSTNRVGRLGTAPEEGIKGPVATATTVEITLAGLQTINGYPLNDGDRVLVKNQSDSSENGLYCAGIGQWSRTTDWNRANDVVNGVLVLESFTGALYRAVFSGEFQVNVTPVTFVDVSSGIVFDGTDAIKDPVEAATNTEITLSGLQVIDGYTTLDGDRILVKNQTDLTLNGIYLASTGAWGRAVDWNTDDDAIDGVIVVDKNKNTIYRADFDGSFVIDTTDVTFFKVSGSGSGGGVYEDWKGAIRLENYAEPTDDYIEQAFARYVADINDTSSENFGKFSLIIGPNPNDSTGKWEQFVPIQMFTNLHVKSEGYLIDWVSTDDTVNTRRTRGMWEAIADDPTVETTITAPVLGAQSGETTITVADSTGMAAGGFVEINVNPQVDFLTGIFPRVTRFNQVTEVIDGTTIKIDTPIFWDLPVSTGIATVKFFTKDSVPQNIIMEGFRFYDSSFQGLTPGVQTPAYVIGPIFFMHVSNTQTIDCKGENLKLPLVQYNRFHDIYARNLESIRPTAREGGEGYTIQCSNGVHARLEDIKGQATRHVWDFTSVSQGVAINCIAGKPSGFIYADYTLHGQAEDHITAINCIGTNWGLDSDTAQFGGYNKKVHFIDCNFSGTTTPRQGLQTKYSNCYLGAWRSTADGIAADIEFDSCRFFSTDEINFVADGRVAGTEYDSKLVMEGTSRLRCSSIKVEGFDSVYLGNEVEFYSAGATNGLVTVLDCPTTINNARSENVVFSYQGLSEDITIGAKIDLTTNGASLISAAVRLSAGTSTEPIKLKVTPEAFFKGKSGEPTHRPFLIQQGSGTATDCELTWTGGTFEDFEDVCALVDTLSYSGTITGMNFGASGASYVIGGGDNLLPTTIVTSGNYYANPANNYEQPTSSATFAIETLTVSGGVSNASLSSSLTAFNFENTGYTNTVNITGASISTTDITLPAGEYDLNLNMTSRRSAAQVDNLQVDLNVISGDTQTLPLGSARNGAPSNSDIYCNLGVSKSFTLDQESVINIRTDTVGGATIVGVSGNASSFELQIVKKIVS